MKVQEFIHHLTDIVKNVPEVGEMKLYTSKDGEGNEFRPYSGGYGIEPECEVSENADVSEDEVFILWPDW